MDQSEKTLYLLEFKLSVTDFRERYEQQVSLYCEILQSLYPNYAIQLKHCKLIQLSDGQLFDIKGPIIPIEKIIRKLAK